MDFTSMKNFMDHLTDWRMPGNSIVMYHQGKEVFRYSSGYADLENKIPMQGNELFNIYSCTKVATAVAALQLYEQGRFLLDDPLYAYIPEYASMQIRGANGELSEAKNPITLRQLFTHTAGLSYNLGAPAVRALCEQNSAAPTVDVIKAFAKEPLLFEPGTRWQYSFAIDVIGALVEVISGQKFSEYVKEHVFAPIGVTDIYFHRTQDVQAKLAQQYRYLTAGNESDDLVKMQISSGNYDGYLQNMGKAVSHELGSEFDSGGAGISTSVESYAKFADALAMGGKAANGERILSAGTVELMRTNQLTPAQAQGMTWSQLTGYGFGLGVRTMVDKARSGSIGSVGEFGWGGAAGATILVDPDLGFSYFYTHHMCNPQEDYYQPRLRNVAYNCLKR